MSLNGQNRIEKATRLVFTGLSSIVFTALTVFTLSFAGAASAQTESETSKPQFTLPPTDGLSLNVGPASHNSDINTQSFVGFGPVLQGAIIELPTESIGSRLFNMSAVDLNCVTGETGCLKRSEKLDLGYSKSITKKIDDGLDIELTPRVAASFNDDGSSAVVGALVKIGDDLREDSDIKSNTWYMFAGADAEAVTYAPGSVRRIASGQFGLQDRIIVGDAQAGVGYKIGDADVSLGYFRREVTSFGREVNSGSVSFKEDAAALSFTWRR